MLRWGAAAYALLGILALLLVSFWRGGSPLLHPDPWLVLDPSARHVYSALWGVAFAGLLVICTRFAVTRFAWARELHAALRPFASGMSLPAIVLIAMLSAFGEEMLFRGLLAPSIGVVPQALIFGAAHQIRGSSRWVWVSWATVVGLALGAMYQLTGSLVGPLAAHAIVNACNLAYLKSYDPSPRHALGGLLGASASATASGTQVPNS
ncbi:MAG TPA: CPBP family intramembrane glutamic endopeptidase [Polyangiaceae bacterium]|nr:CPBP family intramembrane glutamic endopeptidase [Polyangiaceae bacterium]